MLHGIANERVRFAADRFWSQVFTVDRYRRKLVLNVPRHRIQTLTPSPTSSTSRMSRVFALFTYPTTLFNPAPIFPATVTSRSDPSICFASPFACIFGSICCNFLPLVFSFARPLDPRCIMQWLRKASAL